MKTIIKNGKVLTPQGVVEGEVLVDGPTIASVGRECGNADETIEVGKDADIVIWKGDVEVVRTIIGGRTVYQR